MYVRKNLLSMFSALKVHFHNLNMVPPSGCGRCQPTKGSTWDQDPRKYHRGGGKEKCLADQQRNPGGICPVPFYSHETLIFSTKFLFDLFQSCRQQRRTRLTLRNTNFNNKPRPTRLCIQTSKKNSPTRALHIANQALLFVWPSLKYVLPCVLINLMPRFIKLNLAQSLSNNTKFYFSGQQSELGALFNKILGNG